MRPMRSLTVPSVLRRIRFISAVAFVSVLAIPAGAFAKSSALVVTPKTLNLGNEVFGVSGATSTAQPVTISNPKKSSASITIASFSLGGKDAGDFAVQDPHHCKDSAVTPDSSCIVEVTFTPTALGARSATFYRDGLGRQQHQGDHRQGEGDCGRAGNRDEGDIVRESSTRHVQHDAGASDQCQLCGAGDKRNHHQGQRVYEPELRGDAGCKRWHVHGLRHVHANFGKDGQGNSGVWESRSRRRRRRQSAEGEIVRSGVWSGSVRHCDADSDRDTDSDRDADAGSRASDTNPSPGRHALRD